MLEKVRDEWQTRTVTSQTSLSSFTSQNEKERETYIMVKQGAAECNTKGTITILQRHSFFPVYAAFLVTLPARQAGGEAKDSCLTTEQGKVQGWLSTRHSPPPYF